MSNSIYENTIKDLTLFEASTDSIINYLNDIYGIFFLFISILALLIYFYQIFFVRIYRCERPLDKNV